MDDEKTQPTTETPDDSSEFEYDDEKLLRIAAKLAEQPWTDEGLRLRVIKYLAGTALRIFDRHEAAVTRRCEMDAFMATQERSTSVRKAPAKRGRTSKR